MKIVCDSHIPYIRQGLESLADEVVYMPGSDITRQSLLDADVLVTRTRTHVDRHLLEGTTVQLVVTATIGYDHLDTQYLDTAGIAWHNCAGCNASSVGQYIHSSLLVLQRQGLLEEKPVVAIVGHGHVGHAVEEWIQGLAGGLLFDDPPLGETDVPWDADVVTFHTPLIHDGLHPTWHLADDKFFSRLRHRPVVINSARGGVVDEEAMLRALESGQIRAAVVDTWEHEPAINRKLLQQAVIATPHIAGYSADGKANASRMTVETIARHFGLENRVEILPPALPWHEPLDSDPEAMALSLYNPMDDTARLKAAPGEFENLRSHYPLRRETMQ